MSAALRPIAYCFQTIFLLCKRHYLSEELAAEILGKEAVEDFKAFVEPFRQANRRIRKQNQANAGAVLAFCNRLLENHPQENR